MNTSHVQSNLPRYKYLPHSNTHTHISHVRSSHLNLFLSSPFLCLTAIEAMSYAKMLLQGGENQNHARSLNRDQDQKSIEPSSSRTTAFVSGDVPRVSSNDRVPSSNESERSRRRVTDNKRVSNRRLRCEMGYVLRYPSYREGLSALHQGNTDPF